MGTTNKWADCHWKDAPGSGQDLPAAARFAAGAEEGHQKANQEAGFSASKIWYTAPNIDSYQARSRNCKNRLLTSSRLSSQMKQLESHWTNFREI
jgi:hypothetical protein